jgi:glycosyltransferase involved in cell wall biosynthesis
MRISAIIPVFSRQELAMRAIRSALSQSGPLIEVIVVDDCSPDPFVAQPDVLADARLRLIRLKENGGAGAARNAGIAAAKGDWIAFLDSDDTWEPGKIERQAAFVEADRAGNRNSLVLYVTGFRQINMLTGTRADRTPIATSDPRDFASGCWYSPGSTALFSKSLIECVGGLDPSLRRLEDLDWSIRLGLAGGRLSVAPFLGSTIEVGGRPTLDGLQPSCGQLFEKWESRAEISRVPGMQRRLQAYLDIERAAACYHSKNYLRATFFIARSLLRVPRTTLQLKRWWV